MIRIETSSGWILVEHREHARLAGRFARHWGNAEFKPPEPRSEILVAVARHDDAWAERDARPSLTREGRPSAFSQELVGTYRAFEEIDLADYLAVRGRAAKTVAARNPYAAIVISMHTLDLLTGQADLRGLGDADLALLRDFIAEQRRWQDELVAKLAGRPDTADAVAPARLRRSFEFLQACDSLSLAACVRFPRPIPLRHPQARRDQLATVLECEPLGGDTYRVSPYPFDEEEIRVETPCRHLPGKKFADEAAFRAAYAAVPPVPLKVRIVK